MIGETISHYRILDKLGEGGMGAVYRARDTKLKPDVAVKVLPEALYERRSPRCGAQKGGILHRGPKSTNINTLKNGNFTTIG